MSSERRGGQGTAGGGGRGEGEWGEEERGNVCLHDWVAGVGDAAFAAETASVGHVER